MKQMRRQITADSKKPMPVGMGVCRLAVFYLALVFLLGSPASAFAETVSVRVGEHSDYTRIVLDFSKLTGYEVKTAGDTITATFDTKDKLDVPTVSDTKLIRSLRSTQSGGGTTLTIGIPAKADIKHYRLMRKIVLDVYAPKAGATTAKPAATPTAAVKPATKAVTTPIAKPAPSKPIISKSAAPKPDIDIKTGKPRNSKPPQSTDAQTSIDDLDVKKLAAELAAQLNEGQPAPSPAQSTAQSTAQNTEKPAATPAMDAANKNAAIIIDKPPTQPVPVMEQAPTIITLSGLAPVRLAVFTRFNDLWIVSDSTTGSVQVPSATGPMAVLMGAARVLRFDNGTAYRYRMPPHSYVSVEKQNLTWRVSVTSMPMQAQSPNVTRVEFDRASGHAKLLAPLDGTSRLLTLQDPDAGDILHIIPSSQPADRIDQARRFSDVEIFSAATGMVLRGLSDDIRVTRIEDYVIITSSQGLIATPDAGPAMITQTQQDTPEEFPRLFDFPNWRQGGLKQLSRNRSKLEQQSANAPNETIRNEMLMNLALLYFANNFGQETLGVLRLLQQRDPDMALNPNFLALRGAAAAMAGHYQDALRDLSTPAIQQHPEVNLWIGYAAAATEQWRMADRSFPADNRMLLQYPENISIPFTIYMAESALRLGRTETANKFLNTLDPWSENTDAHHRAAMAYLKGEAARQEGRTDEALRIWGPVANGLDRLYHAKASLALTNLELAENKITLKDAIDRIDSLRFAWRGDGLEVQILHNLGQLKVRNKQYLDGLHDMKRALEMADRLLSDTVVIQDSMSRVIADIFVGKQAESISPLEAISIYTAYGSLMPTGAEGSLATLHFADFLIRMDLLGKAADIIEAQVQSGAPPQETMPPLGAKLAAVYLLDNKPAQALSALQRTERSGADEKITEERTLLRGRALSELKRTDDAIATLAPLSSNDAQKLKADVLWRAQRWTAAATTIEGMLPAPGKDKIDADAAQMVINAAVAYKLGGDTQSLRSLKARYEADMAKTQMSDTFGVVTREGSRTDLSDRDTILRIAGEVDMFKGFLKSYRDGNGT